MPDRVTLRDVAEEAGVHTSTASRALNPATRSVVNAETVDRVLSVADRLGYRPHPLARGLRTNQTFSVGVVIPDVENPLFGPIIAGIDDGIEAGGYSLLIGNTAHDDPDHTRRVIGSMLERRVDGLILATASRDDEMLERLIEEGTPVVLVNRAAELPIPSIVGDDHAGIGLAVAHLAEFGHRRLGHVAGPQELSTGHERRAAFVEWTDRMGLETGEVEIAEWYQVEPGYSATLRLLDRCPEITAVVGANDLLALGAYRAARERGRTVGKEISITGYNDVPLLDLMQPPLTSVAVPYRRMGSEAARTMLDLIERPDDEAARHVSLRLGPTLVVRGSTGPPAG